MRVGLATVVVVFLGDLRAETASRMELRFVRNHGDVRNMLPVSGETFFKT